MEKSARWLLAILIISFTMSPTVYGCSSSAAAATPGEAEQADTQAYGLPLLPPVSLRGGEKLKVVATTSIVADVVGHVGGDRIELKVLVPVGTDPHSFEPTPRDIAAVSDAHVVFANGAGLEEFLEPLLQNAGEKEQVVHASTGIELRQVEAEEGAEREQGHQHGGDPHTWTDPNNVIVWTHNIEHALSTLDPAGAETYATKAQAYRAALEDLDAWIEQQIAQLPETDRKIVTDHATWGYFSERYGFEMVGAVIPGYSTLSEPSARELAELQDGIRNLGVKAVFVGNTVNPGLAQRVADDTGARLVFLYTGSLSEPDGPASSYLEFMQYNVSQMVSALK